MKKTEITFWGVRGSMAAAGPKTAKYGGNTACVEISCGNTTIICDAGTGIRPLGHELIKRSKGKKIEAAILLSHLHLDHVIGLPFFKPIYQKGNRFVIMNPGRSASRLKADLKKLIGAPYFPVNILDVPASIQFKEFKMKPVRIGPVTIETFKCNHPDNSFAFKFRFPNGKTLVHISDNEPSNDRHKALVRWISRADILIHDAQYTPSQYENKIGWGHSPYIYPVRLAMEAGVKGLVFFHYDPSATDEELDLISAKVEKSGIVLAREGMTLLV